MYVRDILTKERFPAVYTDHGNVENETVYVSEFRILNTVLVNRFTPPMGCKDLAKRRYTSDVDFLQKHNFYLVVF